MLLHTRIEFAQIKQRHFLILARSKTDLQRVVCAEAVTRHATHAGRVGTADGVDVKRHEQITARATQIVELFGE